MKLLGSLKELVKIVFRTSGGKEVEMQPAEQTAAGPVTIEIPDVGAGGSDTVVMESAGATLSNKTIDNSNTIDAEAIADGSVTDAEFQYLAGVTSDIQTQIDGKEPTITTLPVSQGGTGSSSALTNDKAMISSGDAIIESSVTSTELGHLSGVSSSVQTQLDGKAENGANSDITSLSGLTTALSISQGGTGETTANDALNAFLPSQSGNLNKFLKTDGTNVEWAAAGGGSGINYLSDIFDADVSPTTTSVAAISTTNTDYSNFLVSSAGGTLSQDTASSVRGANSYKFVPTASGEFFGLPAFQLAEVDLGKALSIKFDLKNDGVAADFDVVVCRYNSSGVHQETISVAGTASSGTPASAQLPTGLTSFRGFFITGSDATDYYRLFVRHLTSATDAVYLDTLVVGPEAVMEGAIVTDWEEYTPTLTNIVSSNFLGRYRRVGDSMQVNVRATLTGTSTGSMRISIPANYTIDANKLGTSSEQLAVGVATALDSGALYYNGIVSTIPGDFNEVYVITNSAGATWQQNVPFTWASGDKFSINFTVPISEWQSNTQMAARAVEEYASNSSTSDTDDTTSFVYGPAGSPLVGNLTATRTKRVRFTTPILPTDSFKLEIDLYNTGNWVSFSDAQITMQRQNAVTSGVACVRVSGSTTDCDFIFYRYADFLNNGSYGSAGRSWTVFAGAYWRVRKVSGGAAVGFPVGSSNVLFTDIAASTSGGITFSNASGTNTGSVSDAGNWILGTGFSSTHLVKGDLDVEAGVSAPNAAIRAYNGTSTTTNYILSGYSNVGGTNTLKWRVEADGDTISATGSYTSDERAKKNLEGIKYGLAEILKLEPQAFNWWYEEDSEVKSFCVSTAQKLKSIMPELVRDDGLDGPDGEKMMAVYEKEIVAIMVKAIQEQQKQIEALKKEIESLK